MRARAPNYLGYIAIFTMGCGDNALPDGAPMHVPGGPVTFLHQNVSLTEFAFPATVADGHGSALFVIRNDTDAKIAAIELALDGDPGFAIDEAASTCVAGPELVPHDLCTVMVRWTVATDATAQLTVTSGDVISNLPISGQVGSSGVLIADASLIDFGIVTIGSLVSVDVRLTNTGASPIGFFSGSADGNFSFGNSDCEFQLGFSQVVPANGSCNVTVVFTATSPGWIERRDIPIRRLDTGLSVPVTLDAYAAHVLHVVKRGTGTGRIVSVPSGIDCGTECGAQIGTVIGDATLYEQTDDGSQFVGWQLACGMDPSCFVVEGAQGYPFHEGTIPIGVTFAGSDSAPVAFTINGKANGKLFIGTRVTTPDGSYYDQITECTESCTIHVPVGTELELYAATPSKFAGWAGACTGSDTKCIFTTVGDAAATITFDKDDRELVTLLPDDPALQRSRFAPGGSNGAAVGDVEFAANGDLIARGERLAIDPDGTVRPSNDTSPLLVLAYQDGACDVPFGGSTITYRFGSKGLTSPNGDHGGLHSTVVNGQLTNVLSVFKSDGSLRFAVDLGQGCEIAIAVGPDGVYQALVGDQLGVLYVTSFHIVRYDASGNLLQGSGPYTITGALPSVAIDSAGALAFHMLSTDTLPLTAVIGRILFDGTVAFTTTSPEHSFGPTRIGYDAAGNVITSSSPLDEIGIDLEQRSPTGDLLWAFNKRSDLAAQFVFPLDVKDVAFSKTGRVAVAGIYGPVTDGPLPWIEVFQMP